MRESDQASPKNPRSIVADLQDSRPPETAKSSPACSAVAIDQIPLKLAIIASGGIFAQWVAWRLRLPAIVLLLILVVPIVLFQKMIERQQEAEAR